MKLRLLAVALLGLNAFLATTFIQGCKAGPHRGGPTNVVTTEATTRVEEHLYVPATSPTPTGVNSSSFSGAFEAEPTAKPKPKRTTHKPTVRRTTKAPEPEAYYANCTAVRRAGAAPIHRGDPGWQAKFDRDGDGTGCDS